jgi:predicted small metal-binding protein
MAPLRHIRHPADSRGSRRAGIVAGKEDAMKTLKCRDLGHACSFEATGQSVDEILRKAGQHATEHHGIQVTPEVAEAVKQKIREE